ncbi:MAG: hypothetical protein M1830_005616 [Pleopsidium flavum]|nr:MAG: hypothetical protein M1830_005616 [Pleopsidium flavum]
MRRPSPSLSSWRPFNLSAPHRRQKYSARQFYLTVLVISTIAVLSFVAKNSAQNVGALNSATLQRRDLESQGEIQGAHGGLVKRDEECRFVHKAKDKCAFVRVNCPDEEAGLLSYLQLYYCKLHHVKPIAFIILVLWLGLLFSTIGIAASDFFCINLSTIASILGMSESMAGVTFLAFGNGSPDVFSTFAAMSTHSGSLAVGELIGAAGFITAVVAGSMALVRPFNVARKSFVRDVCFFIVAASFSMVFLADGSLHLWECAVMVAFYVFYVIIVVVWHWYLGRRLRRKDREAAARGQFHVPGSEELEVQEADDYDEDAATGERRSLLRGNSAEDFGALERGGSPYLKPGDDEDDDEGRDQWLAEINSNMRISRPQPGVRRNTVRPIRPSLVGALEFRAILSSLQKSRNIQTIPISLRRYSDDPTYTTAQQQDQLSAVSDPELGSVSGISARDIAAHDLLRPSLEVDRSPASQRTRAVSANDAATLRLNPSALNLNAPMARTDRLGRSPGSGGRLRPPVGAQSTSSSAPSRSPSFLVSPPASEPTSRGVSPAPAVDRRISPDRLAPPKDGFTGFPKHYQPINGAAYDSANSPRESPKSVPQQQVPRIVIPSQKSSEHSNPVSPFPAYHDDPESADYTSRPPSIRLPPPSLFSHPSYHQDFYDDVEEKPLRWWPYSILPEPRILASTLFPTVYSWHDKNIWDKLLGVVAAPSVFLLAITLPVVEAEKDDDESDVVMPDGDLLKPSGDGYQASGRNAKAISSGSPSLEFEGGGLETLSQNVRRKSNHDSIPPNVRGFGGHGNTAAVATSTKNLHRHDYHVDPPPPPSPLAQQSEQSPTEPTSSASPPSSPREWNRWLVSTQIFTAPFFVVLIVWANTSEPPHPHDLLLPCLYSLVSSLVLFAILLLTTSPSKPPRHRYLLCFLGFVVSIAWISTIANEVVGVLKAFGVILGISDAILGLTIFAVGNSLGDLVADITVANLGYPVMALSACFGGPMLNILLGIGVSGLYMTITDGEHRHERHPGRPMKYKPYQIEVSSTLVISGATLLVTLVGLLIVVPLNGWKMDRRIGWGLVALWCVSTVGNLVVEVTGWGGDLA